MTLSGCFIWNAVHVPFARCRAVDKRWRHIPIHRLLLLLLLPVCGWRRWRWSVCCLRWTHSAVWDQRHPIGVVKTAVVVAVTLYANRSRYGSWKCGYWSSRCTPTATRVRLNPCVAVTHWNHSYSFNRQVGKTQLQTDREEMRMQALFIVRVMCENNLVNVSKKHSSDEVRVN